MLSMEKTIVAKVISIFITSSSRPTVKLLISARAAINSSRALEPAAVGGRRLSEVYN